MIQMEITLRSTILDFDTKVNVLLPEDRHNTTDTRGKKYPVLYVLHGMKEDCSSWLHLSNLFLLCRDLDLIVVFPSANNSSYVDQVYGLNYFKYITEELPTKLKNFLPIDDDPDKTFIMGESMGGYGTMRCALGAPEKYGKAVCLSAGNIATRPIKHRAMELSFGLDNDKVLNSDNNLFLLMDKCKNAKHVPDIKVFCGTDDFIYENCKEMVEVLKDKLPEHFKGFEFSKGEHNFFYWNSILPKALEFFGFEVKQNSVI